MAKIKFSGRNSDWFDAFSDMCDKVVKLILQVDKRAHILEGVAKSEEFSEEVRHDAEVAGCAYLMVLDLIEKIFPVEIQKDGSDGQGKAC